jgi:hypothetical protein
MLGFDDRQGLGAIRRLEHPMPLIPQNRDQKVPVGLDIVDD